MRHPDWSKNATLYQVNVRCFTPEGTFTAFKAHLPRIKALGVDVIWLMPIHPIGVVNRKGILGSPYSVKDYYAINPEFGTLADFQSLVDEIHRLGMKVIIDWVPNHSAWDNELVQKHPNWYSKSPDGDFQPTPWYDWEDIIEFDYSVPEMRQYMTHALCHWVEKYDIDGFRCDVAGFVPLDFWVETRTLLEKIKPVFLLAEWENRDLHVAAFDASYAWSLWVVLHNIVKNGGGLGGMFEYLALDIKTFPNHAYRMTFTDNHDKNSWEGTQFDNFGEALETCIVFTNVMRGIPLIYGGQEAGLNKSLAFFEKDEIEWKEHSLADLFTQLFALKHQNKALWNGEFGGLLHRMTHNQPQKVIAFYREKEGHQVISITNFSNEPVAVTLQMPQIGCFHSFRTNAEIQIEKELKLNLAPWGYELYTQHT